MKKIKAFNVISLIIISLFFFSCSKEPFSREEKTILYLQNNRHLNSRFNDFLSSSEATRFRLALASGNSMDTLIVPQMVSLLNDNSPLVRLGAVFSLGLLDCSNSHRLLMEVLKYEKDYNVRKQILISLGNIGDIETVIYLVYNCDDCESANLFLPSLVNFFDRGVVTFGRVKYSISNLNEGDFINRRWASDALSRVKQTQFLLPYIDSLIKAASCSDPEVRVRIPCILKNLNFNNKLSVFRNMVHDENWNVRVEVAKVLKNIPGSDVLWFEAINDSNPHVIATALDNYPVELNLNEEQLQFVYSLLENHSKRIRGAAIQFLISKYGLESLKRVEIFPLPDYLLEYEIAGLSKWGKKDAIDVLRELSQNRRASISTPAFDGLLNVSKQLVLENKLEFDSLLTLIKIGLRSKDIAKVALSAAAMHDTVGDFIPIISVLYNAMENIDGYLNAEAILEILKTIEKIRPSDALDHIKPFLTSNFLAVRERSKEVIESLYEVDESFYPDEQFISSKQPGLSKLFQHGLMPLVKIETDKGTIIIQCDGYYAPFTTSAFLDLVDRGFYNGLTFHRVVTNFVIQGGDPRGDGWGGPEFTLLTESSPIGYGIGSVGMASAGRNTEGSQFFITISPQTHLDFDYTRFGEVIEGMDVVYRVDKGDMIFSAKVVK
ncbi:MAG: peptidylprolyl isomerase [Candidatus Marinimicrobia bacterium]|nr:peptidylprolyl isomerase [Candidatus Neomarinimicrobiota bacterium]